MRDRVCLPKMICITIFLPASVDHAYIEVLCRLCIHKWVDSANTPIREGVETVIDTLQVRNNLFETVIDTLQVSHNLFETVIDTLQVSHNLFETVIDTLQVSHNLF